MRSILTILVGAALAAACAIQAPPPAPTPAPAARAVPDAPDAMDGRAIAERLCATCHAPGLEGESANAAAPPLRTLAERYPGALLAEAFPQRMDVGHPAMPAFELSDAQVNALLDYILSIQERRGA